MEITSLWSRPSSQQTDAGFMPELIYLKILKWVIMGVVSLLYKNRQLQIFPLPSDLNWMHSLYWLFHHAQWYPVGFLIIRNGQNCFLAFPIEKFQSCACSLWKICIKIAQFLTNNIEAIQICERIVLFKNRYESLFFFLPYWRPESVVLEAPTDPNSVGVRTSGVKTIFTKWYGFEHLLTSALSSNPKTII